MSKLLPGSLNRQLSTRRFLALIQLASVFALIASQGAEAQSIAYKTIALSGDAAPDAGPDVSFSSFHVPVLNEAGQVAFTCVLLGRGVTDANNNVIYSGSGGALGMVAREGNPATGAGSDVDFSVFIGSPVLNDAGQTAFLSFLAGVNVNVTNRTGVFSETAGMTNLVARAGSAVPSGGTDVNFGFFRTVLLNNAGQTAFFADLAGAGVDGTNDQGIFSESGGTLCLIARRGGAAAGAGLGVNFDNFGAPVLNDAGQAAFVARLVGTGVVSANRSGVFSESGGALNLVARAGAAASGTGPSVNFLDFNYPVLNDAGQTAFLARLAGAGVTSTNDQGIFSETGGTLSLVAREGDAAPAVGLNVYFGDLSFGDPVLNNAGETAFLAFLSGANVDGTNDLGIFSESGGTLGLVARKGNAAPGVGPGVNFNGFNLPVLNDAGQTAFSASLTGNGVVNTNNEGLFATDPTGALRLIARQGALFDINPDPQVTENRTISNVFLKSGSGGSDGRPRSFNSAGQLAFKLEFTDGTQGIFVANVSVPEPSAILLTTLAVLGLSATRRRQR